VSGFPPDCLQSICAPSWTATRSSPSPFEVKPKSEINDSPLFLLPTVSFDSVMDLSRFNCDLNKLAFSHIPSFTLTAFRSGPQRLAAAALELGPIGFVLKYSGGSELSRAIDHALRGQTYVTPKLRPTDWAEAEQRAREYKKENDSETKRRRAERFGRIPCSTRVGQLH
jgi:hypothetical protein